jgi:hypothetical protein
VTVRWQSLMVMLLLLAIAGAAAWHAHQMEKRLAVVEHAALYLFVPTEVLDEQGKPLRRVDLFDRFLANALKQK